MVRRSLLAVPLSALAACGGPAAGPPAPAPAPAPHVLDVAVSVDSVVRAAASVLTKLEWVLTSHDVAEGTLAAERQALYDRNSEWMSCPEGYVWTGAPGVRFPRSTMAIELEASRDGDRTRVRITGRALRAEAYDPLTRSMERVQCVSAGAIERVLADSLRARFAGR